MDHADRKMLESILDDLNHLGIGKDEAVDGADAVEYLNDLRDDLKRYLKA